MYHKFDTFGWWSGTSALETPRSTGIAPETQPQFPPVPGQDYPNFTGHAWVNIPFPGTTAPEA